MKTNLSLFLSTCLEKSYFDVLEFQHSFSVSCVADVPRSSEWPLQGNQASM